MNLLNIEELKRQIANGTFTSLDDITKEFKNILKEVIQTASQEELTSHLGYDKHQESQTSNYRNGYNDKTTKSKYVNIDVAIPRDIQLHLDDLYGYELSTQTISNITEKVVEKAKE